ncbi:MAG: membrane protein of unknown function [Nitrosopumilales archaeon]|nr:MAG: membrane protein of unknown function [Nitrosopumilales archaeon]
MYCNNGKCKKVRRGEERHDLHNGIDNDQMKKNNPVTAAWGVILGGVIIAFGLAAFSVIFPDSIIGQKDLGGNLIIMGLILDITGVTVVLIPELANRVKRIGQKGDEAIAVVASQRVGSVDKYRFLARGFFLLILGFGFQIIGNFLSD